MLLTKEHEILRVMADRPWAALTFREVKTLSRKRSESYVYNTLKKLVKEEIISEERKGNVVLYHLNASLHAAAYAGIVAEHATKSAKQLPHALLEALAKKIPTAFFVLLVTGSYAEGTQKKVSDLDVVIICDNAERPARISAEIRHFCETSVPAVHPYIFTQQEFLTMLLDEKQNYGKEAARKHLITAGGREYYTIIGEAVRHGFTR